MPVAINSLPKVAFDLTGKGVALQAGLKQAEGLIASDRSGHLLLEVNVPAGVLPVVMDKSSLYILGFRCDAGWRRFNDAEWPFSDNAAALGYTGQYDALGGLGGTLTAQSIAGIGKLLQAANQHQWKPALVTLLVVVAENLRLVPVRMRILGLLNGVMDEMPLSEVAGYIKKWSQASEGKDMSTQVSENLRVGFSDPTIIKR
jgi:hypothetical protein